ncbi:L-galactose dehydrogenase [Thozetella sp. PMI_491]|nr:L-galactose dehydrogenase [Thozetella sp. PMI_491]
MAAVPLAVDTPPLRAVSAALPPLFLGTATFNTQHVKDPLQMPYRQIVARALELGVNGFDTSPYYGPSEVLLGDALAACTVATGLPRESYVLVTKAGRIGPQEFDYSPSYVRYSVLRSLARLGTDYLDLVYMHDVEFMSPEEVLQAVQALRQLRDEGKIRYVGISGFPVHELCSLAEMVLVATGEPLDAVLSYGHFTIQNPSLGLAELAGGAQHPDEAAPLRRFKKAGVDVVLNASMLGMGLLTQTGIPAGSNLADGDRGSMIAKWHPSPDGLRIACHKLAEIATGAGERLEAVALRWSMEQYAYVGASAGLGVELPSASGAKIGGSVMGVTSLYELEQTVALWREILDGYAASGSPNPSRTDSHRHDAKGDKLNQLVQGQMWPALGEWKCYSWASPEEGFVNRRGDQMGVVPDGDKLQGLLAKIPSSL